MASMLKTSVVTSCSLTSSKRVINAAIHLPKLPNISLPPTKIQTSRKQLLDHQQLILEKYNNNKNNTQILHDQQQENSTNSKVIVQLYAVLEAVSDRVEMHQNIGEQRNNWNNLLLNSINMITLTATTMSGVAAVTSGEGAPLLALKLSSALLFSAATGLLLIMNKIQPSQLTEEQRNATRLFKQLQTQIQTTIAIGNPTEDDVKGAMEKVLALDKAYPLPLLGAMLEKFPAKYEPAVWWPSKKGKTQSKKMGKMDNGWSEELEMEMREVVEVIKRKDAEDYDRLGNIALKINKSLAIAGPLLTGMAAIGSSFIGNGSSLAAFVPLLAGSLAAAVNTFEHGGQVGMVFEMYRTSGGFFKMLETSIESTLGEKDVEKRENGELFEMKMALQLGRSISNLRELASKSATVGTRRRDDMIAYRRLDRAVESSRRVGADDGKDSQLRTGREDIETRVEAQVDTEVEAQTELEVTKAHTKVETQADTEMETHVDNETTTQVGEDVKAQAETGVTALANIESIVQIYGGFPRECSDNSFLRIYQSCGI
ncbi:probable F-box protein At4g22030 [Vicia villosa]|uniref:probable F-box protein At4g22030 n=1 Tax=Vicia villosa TaxID=3911 RepID=UPI00273C0ABA|nr:probable F-box protein At4g22030 [Vicia villosa]